MNRIMNRMCLALCSVLVSASMAFAQSDLIITGVMDGTLSGGTPKVMEIYAVNNVADASGYSVYRYSNGGSSASSAYSFPAISLTAGQFYTITSDSTQYYAWFGSSADATGSIFVNGDDILELRLNSDTVDVFGQYGVDGTGECWEYADGWAYRNDGSSPTSSFSCNDWSFSGKDALDGAGSNAGASTPFPTASYSGASMPSFTTHQVSNAGQNFVPDSIYIEAGDSVHWTIAGFHNVNGDQGTYPNNPESFFSGPAPITSFGHRFMISGAYDYQCDPHAGNGMVGYIEVQGDLNDVTSLGVTSSGEDEVNVSWMKPMGVNGIDWDGVAVFMSESPFSGFFTNNAQELSNYTGNFSYGAGTMVSADGTNNGYCIYNSMSDADGNIDIDGLIENTTYYVVAYAYRTVDASDDEVSAESSASATTDAPPTSSDLMIVGSMDGPYSGGHPKVVELYAVNDVMDASEYSVHIYGNGSATATTTVATLPAISMTAGDRYYITGDSAAFYTFFGVSSDQTGSTFLNGDDALGLQRNGVLVDAMGAIGTDGTGECWEWLDGWGYRNNGGSPSVVFSCADWSFSGINAMDGQADNASATIPYPIGSYGVVATIDLEITEVMAASGLGSSSIDGDWFEIRNNGNSSIDLSGYSWDDDSQTAGMHTFGSYILPSGQSVIVLDEDSADILAWTNEWNQTANSIRVIGRDMFGGIGFSGLDAADGVYLYDGSSNMISSAMYASSTSGFSNEFSNGMATQSVDGVNGAYTSNGGDVGSPSDMAPVVVVIPTYSIADVRGIDASGVADSLNVECKLNGIVTSIDFDGNGGYSFYMTDGTQGINVFSFSDVSGYQVTMGDSIRVIGSIAQFRGLLEIVPDSIVLRNQGNTLPAPMVVTALGEATESELIKFENVALVDTADWPSSATSRNVDFYTMGGDTMTMRIDFDAQIFGNTPTGMFDLTGVGAQYNSSSSAPYLDGYQIFPRSNSDIVPVAAGCSDVIDSVETVNLAQGVYRVWFNGPFMAADNYTMEWKTDTGSTWRSKSFNSPNQASAKINITPWFNNTIAIRVGMNNGGNMTYSCEETFATPCRPMTIQTAEQKAATCVDDSALVRVGYAGGRGPKTILWSNGGTAKRTYADQGETLTVTVTDETGCSVTDQITASVLAGTAEAPTNVGTTRNGTVVTVTWNAASLGAGQSLIGYRIQYRLRGTSTWTSGSLTTNLTDDVDFAGGTPGNYEFSAITRYSDNGTPTTSARACFTVRGVPSTKNDGLSGSDAASTIAVYPNPANNELFVSAIAGSDVALMDLNGRILAHQTVDAAEVSFDLSDLASGAYMVRITNGDEVAVEKVIKE